MTQVVSLQGARTTLYASEINYHRALLWTILSIQVFGIVMVASSSLAIADSIHDNSFHFVIRHGLYCLLAWLLALVVMTCSSELWRSLSPYLLILGVLLLVLVLIIGKEVNGSQRWLSLGFMTFQVSEAVKLFFIMYLAGYLVRRKEEVENEFKGFLKPLLVLSVITSLLLLEPDFGAAAMIIATCLAMMFLAGAKFWQFIVLAVTMLIALATVALTQEYRFKRLQAYLDPWDDPFGSGYQLTQSLIAFARGDWWGQGLGASIQKHAYLPEAHTDFLFAILAEELGLFGVVAVVALFVYLFVLLMQIGRRCYLQGNLFQAYTVYGIGMWIGLQAITNIGVNCGLLPTKGITLPLMSSGGSSLIIFTLALAIVLRIDYEMRVQEPPKKGRKK